MLTLSEELTLLAVHDDIGNIILAASASIPVGIACAIMLDLQENGKIKINEDDFTIDIINSDTTKIEFLDKAFRALSSKEKEKSLKFWLRYIANDIKEYQNLIFENLVLNGILRREAKKVMFLIKFERYPTLNPTPELETRDRIHKSVMMGVAADDKLIKLISLMYACNLINEVFPENIRPLAKTNIKKIIENENFGKKVIKVAEEMATLVVSKS